MTFKLSAQCNDIGDITLPHKLYKSYVEHNRWRIPESALGVISHPDWIGNFESKAPLNSVLLTLQLKDVGRSSAELKLILLKERHEEKPFTLEIRYKGLFAIDIPNQEPLSESPLVWHCDEFLHFDAYTSYGIKDKFFTHHIEWLGGKIWSIIARDIEVQWEMMPREREVTPESWTVQQSNGPGT